MTPKIRNRCQYRQFIVFLLALALLLLIIPTISGITATYDSGFGAPRCANESSPCIAPSSLLLSRGTLGTPEPNQPNTIDSCTDGSSGTYQSDESSENITITSLSGSKFITGGKVQVDAWYYCYATGDNLN